LTRIPCDIANDEEPRTYGPAWAGFLMSCRIMLGSESGSKVFDFDGSIAEKCNETMALDPSPSSPSEKEIEMAQFSPRVFEASGDAHRDGAVSCPVFGPDAFRWSRIISIATRSLIGFKTCPRWKRCPSAHFVISSPPALQLSRFCAPDR
jgi:hypothetical protein